MTLPSRINGTGVHPHHCANCGKPPTQRCLDKMHVSYCEECGHIFAVESQGCSMHSYADCYNLTIKKLSKGLPGNDRTEWEKKILKQRAQEKRKAAERPAPITIEPRARRKSSRHDSRPTPPSPMRPPPSPMRPKSRRGSAREGNIASACDGSLETVRE